MKSKFILCLLLHDLSDFQNQTIVLDGCPNSCNGHGSCRRYGDSGYKCDCHAGWKGTGCAIAMEMMCSNGDDDDNGT